MSIGPSQTTCNYTKQPATKHKQAGGRGVAGGSGVGGVFSLWLWLLLWLMLLCADDGDSDVDSDGDGAGDDAVRVMVL